MYCTATRKPQTHLVDVAVQGGVEHAERLGHHRDGVLHRGVQGAVALRGRVMVFSPGFSRACCVAGRVYGAVGAIV